MKTNNIQLSTGLLKILLVSFLFLLSSCGTGSYMVKIKETDLQKKFSERVNTPISLIKIFDVSLSNPIVKLDGVTERLNANFDVKLYNLLNGKPTYGLVGVSGVLKYDETKSVIIFSEAQVEKVVITDADKNLLEDQKSLLVSLLTKKLGGLFLSGITLRKVDPKELKVGFLKFKPTDIKVADGSLLITLVPSD